jgi:hypothetical protein
LNLNDILQRERPADDGPHQFEATGFREDQQRTAGKRPSEILTDGNQDSIVGRRHGQCSSLLRQDLYGRHRQQDLGRLFAAVAIHARKVRNPVRRGHRFRSKADSIPVIADSA